MGIDELPCVVFCLKSHFSFPSSLAHCPEVLTNDALLVGYLLIVILPCMRHILAYHALFSFHWANIRINKKTPTSRKCRRINKSGMALLLLLDCPRVKCLVVVNLALFKQRA